MSISVIVNGESHALEGDRATVSALLASLGIETARGRTVVERNRKIVPQSEFDDTSLADGDHLEIIQFVGGG